MSASKKTKKRPTKEDAATRPMATLDELFVERDAKGEVLPMRVESPLLGRTFLCKPLTYGFIRKSDDMSKPMVEWPLERKVDFLRAHFIQPDMSGITIEKVEELMDPMTLDHLISLVMVRSAPFSRIQTGQAGGLEVLKTVLRHAAARRASEPSTIGSTP